MYRTQRERRARIGSASTLPPPSGTDATALPVAAFFARYRQRCLAQLAQHGHAAGAEACRCGQPLPCAAEAGLEQMLETVVGSAD